MSFGDSEQNGEAGMTTGIVCTVDEADVQTLGEMIGAGMRLACVTYESNRLLDVEKTLQNLKQALEFQPGKTCGVMLNLEQSSTIELDLPTQYDVLKLEEGDKLTIVSTLFAEDSDDSTCSEIELTCKQTDLYKMVHSGQQIIADRGCLRLKVTSVEESKVTVKCLNDYVMTDKLSLTVQGMEFGDSSVTQKSLAELKDLITSYSIVEYI